MHQLNAAEQNASTSEILESHHRPRSAFDRTMILLHDIVEGHCHIAEMVGQGRVMKNAKSLYHGHRFPVTGASSYRFRLFIQRVSRGFRSVLLVGSAASYFYLDAVRLVTRVGRKQPTH